MARFFIIISVLFVLAPLQVLAASLSEDEATISLCIRTLHDPREPMRQEAARVLRRIVRRYPSKTVNIRWRDGGAAFWREKVNRIQVGMDLKEAGRILLNPEFDVIGIVNGPVRYDAQAQLDGHWAISIPARGAFSPPQSFNYTIRARPELIEFDKRIEVKPPAGYSGPWAVYYVNGQKLRQARYLNGEYDGLSTEYFSNGRRGSRIYMKNGHFGGAYATWYPNGKVEEQHDNYRANGNYDGRSRSWYSNGRRKSDGHYKDGALDGLNRSWFENGRLRTTGSYKKGRPVGHHVEWFENGRKFIESFWSSNGLNGVTYEWDERGLVLWRQAVRNGKEGDRQLLTAPKSPNLP